MHRMRILPLFLILIGLLSGCVSSMGEFSTVGCIENQTGSGFSMKYEDLDGVKYYVYTPREDYAATLRFETLEGTISCRINAKDGGAVLVRENIPTKDFRVKLEKGVSYTFKFTADHHKGSFSVGWEPLD